MVILAYKIPDKLEVSCITYEMCNVLYMLTKREVVGLQAVIHYVFDQL